MGNTSTTTSAETLNNFQHDSNENSSSTFRSCISRKQQQCVTFDSSLPIADAREERRKVFPHDCSDRELEYHRVSVSSRNIVSNAAQGALAKYVFAHDLPHGTHSHVLKPDEFGMNGTEFLIKTSDNELLHCYWLTEYENSEYTIFYLHGASGNIGHRLEVAKILQKGLKCDILLIDFRGFGKSTGSPTELGVYLDAQAGLDWLLSFCTKKIIVFGTSLGAAIAMHLVSQEDNARHIYCVILENCFTSVCEISRYYVPNWARPILDLIKSASVGPLFDCLSKAPRVKCRLLYLVGLRDPVVPSWMSQVLFTQSTSSQIKHLHEFPTGHHNDLPNFDNYCSVMLNFLKI